MNLFVQTVNDMQEILAICPCCDDIFRLVDGKLSFAGKKPAGMNPYLSLLDEEKKLGKAEEKISLAEERFEMKFEKQRELLLEQSRKAAKRKLRKIDPIFASKGIDHQDVKVIFDPIEYVIFKGLSSKDRISEISLLSRKPTNSKKEWVTKSIQHVIKSGNVEFETLYLTADGKFDIKSSKP